MSIFWFLSSLIPLSICTAIMYSSLKRILIPSCIVIVIGFLFLLGLFFFILTKRKAVKSKTKELHDIHLNRHIPIDFLFAYVLPLIAFDLSNNKQAICFIVIICVYFVLYWRNRTYHVNVFLYLIGYKAYFCKDENEKEIMVIAKKGWNSFTKSNAKCFSLGGEDSWFVMEHISSKS